MTEGNFLIDFTKNEEIIDVENISKNNNNNNNNSSRKSKIKRILDIHESNENESTENNELESGLKNIKYLQTPLLFDKNDNINERNIDKENSRYSQSSFEPVFLLLLLLFLD